MSRLEMYVSHLWTAVYNRAQRENQPVGVLGYYKLNNDGSRPAITRREEWLEMATSVVNGDAAAVAAGYPAAVNPSAAEVQAVLDTAVASRTIYRLLTRLMMKRKRPLTRCAPKRTR